MIAESKLVITKGLNLITDIDYYSIVESLEDYYELINSTEIKEWINSLEADVSKEEICPE